jgi:hyaluronoglucosaminidase
MNGEKRKFMKSKPVSLHWGYIEGYYWRLMAWEDRGLLVEHLGRLGGDSYIYAPKEDPLHRREWRTPYGKKWLSQWSKFATQASGSGVQAIPGMAPGLSFDYLDKKDYQILLHKLEAFRDAGSDLLALLMDDIVADLPKNCQGKFRSLGEAHGKLLTSLLTDLNRNGKRCRLWFCPTVYTDQFARNAQGKTDFPIKDPYLLDLAATMPSAITVLWTGPGIISEKLTATSIRPVANLFKGNLIIWDNLYANDYCPNKLFVGPYRNRPKGIWDWTRGVLLNPTGLPVTDMFLLTLLAASRAGVNPAKAWGEALDAFAVPAGFRKVARFLDSPFFKTQPRDSQPAEIEALRKVLHPLIWDWVSPLHREWATYLFMLDADLKVGLKGKQGPDAAWVRKRYTPIMAKLLLER